MPRRPGCASGGTHGNDDGDDIPDGKDCSLSYRALAPVAGARQGGHRALDGACLLRHRAFGKNTGLWSGKVLASATACNEAASLLMFPLAR